MSAAIQVTAPPPRPSRTENRAPEVVKSAVRVLEVLEFFDGTRAPACVGSVAGALGFPQSSTSALLRSLVKVGYLRYDANDRTYFPTERVPLLGHGIGQPLFNGGKVLDLMQMLVEQTGCGVVLARRTGCRAQYVHLAGVPNAVPHGLKIGAMLSLTGTAVGQVLLAGLPDSELRRLLHRLNAEAGAGETVRVSEFVTRIADTRAAGFATAADPSCTVLAMRLPVGDDPLVIGVAGSQVTVADRRDALLAAMRKSIATCLRLPRRTLPDFDVPAPFALRDPRRPMQHATA